MGGFIQRTTMLLCISFGGLLALFSLADAAQFKLNVILKELDGSKPFDATVTIKAGEIAQQLTRKNTGQYAFEGDLGPTALDKYEVLVEPPPSHFARSVKAKAHKLSQSISSVLNLFITKDSDKFTYKYLDDG